MFFDIHGQLFFRYSYSYCDRVRRGVYMCVCVCVSRLNTRFNSSGLPCCAAESSRTFLKPGKSGDCFGRLHLPGTKRSRGLCFDRVRRVDNISGPFRRWPYDTDTDTAHQVTRVLDTRTPDVKTRTGWMLADGRHGVCSWYHHDSTRPDQQPRFSFPLGRLRTELDEVFFVGTRRRGRRGLGGARRWRPDPPNLT